MRESFNHQKLPKKVLQILDNFAPKAVNATRTLFVGDLSVICDEIKLYELFSRFGGVESVQLKKSDRDPQRAHLGFGFIIFATHEAAERALKETNGYFLLGRSMRVDWAVDLGEKGFQSLEKAFRPKIKPTAQIHVAFVTRELNRRVSELDLGGVFSRYGNLVDSAIKKNAINNGYGVQSGYAFVHFSLTPEGLKSALAAVEEVNNLVVDNIAYQCKLTHTLQAQLLSMNTLEEDFGRTGIPIVTLPDSTLTTYDSSSHRMNPFEMDPFPQRTAHSFPANQYPLVSEDKYGRGFHSSVMDPTVMASRTGHTFSPESPNLNYHAHAFETANIDSASSSSSNKITDYRVINSLTREEFSNSRQYLYP